MAQESNPFFVNPLGGADIAGGLAGFGKVYAANQEKEELLQKQATMKTEVQEAYKSKNPDAIANIMLKYPEYQQQIAGAVSFKNEATKNNALVTLRDVLTNPENAEQVLKSRIAFLKSQGVTDTSATEQELEAYRANPEGFKKRSEMLFASLAPNEYTVYSKDSTKKYEQGKGDAAGYSFDPETGKFTIDPEVRAALAADAKAKMEAEGGLKTTDLKDINNKVTDLTKETRGIYNNALALDDLKSNSSAAAKLAAVFKFMKALDPSSVVRETEQGQVYSASGAAGQLAGKLNSLLGEGELTADGFADVANTAKVLANSAVEASEREVEDYLTVFEDRVPPALLSKMRGRVPQKLAKYKLGETITSNGKKYKVVGGDLNDPEVELLP